MSRPLRTLLGTLALVALAVVVVIGVIRTAGPVGGGPSAPASATTSPPQDALTAEQAGRAFLDGYVDPDGRVVRRDQGGDTVSEGQAYGLLVAVGLGDRDAFTRIWGWTKAHLLRADDGLLSWHWQDGKVLDGSPASDADLDAARALVVAGSRFDDASWTAAGTALGRAVLDHETVGTDLGRILVAGPWATEAPYVYNASYASPAAVAVLAKASPDPRWDDLQVGTRAVTTGLLTAAPLPPDWAHVAADGSVEAIAGADGKSGDGIRYGFDAARTAARLAESCDPADVALAARLAAVFRAHPGSLAVRDLDGTDHGDGRSPVAAAGEAGAYAAAGDDAAATAALLDADALARQSPTYYGAAWDALARLLLTDESLGGCPPLT